MADKLHYEWLRKQKKVNQLRLPEIEPPADEPSSGRQDYECLEKCLAKLPVTERQMIVEYYRDSVDPMWRQMYRDTLLLNADGTLSPPDRPGLGVELNDEALAPWRVE